ncbi:MAG: bifunctional riboflavin kinase/FAD synthetase [Firmicutes bacterium]|nr:bifunctional riboflavin kinase/FAD synthetase [Bacillota bacterium]
MSDIRLEAWETTDEVAVALGTFDGVHLGHQAVLAEMRREAQAGHLLPIALTFDPHPRQVLAPGQSPQLLTTLEQRVSLLHRFGAQQVVIATFTKAFAGLAPEVFAEELLAKRLHAKAVVVGYNYTFGAGGRGRPEDLEQLGKRLGFKTHIVPPVRSEGEIVSSSRIRSCLEQGKVEEALQLLGHEYVMGGEVVRGDGRGHALGFPTANLAVSPEQLLPANGVYVAEVNFDEASSSLKRWGLASIGTRPTFYADAGRTLEVYILDYEGDLYGRRLSISLRHMLRPEQAFANAEALIAQMRADEAEARAYLARLNN